MNMLIERDCLRLKRVEERMDTRRKNSVEVVKRKLLLKTCTGTISEIMEQKNHIGLNSHRIRTGSLVNHTKPVEGGGP